MLIKLKKHKYKTKQNISMIKATSDTNSPPPPPTKASLCPHWVGIGKLEKEVRPSHCVGGVDASGSEATAAAVSTSKEAAEAETADCP